MLRPTRELLEKKLIDARLPVMSIDALRKLAISRAGVPKPIEYTDKVVAVVRYRDGTVMDVVCQVKQ